MTFSDLRFDKNSYYFTLETPLYVISFKPKTAFRDHDKNDVLSAKDMKNKIKDVTLDMPIIKPWDFHKYEIEIAFNENIYEYSFSDLF